MKNERAWASCDTQPPDEWIEVIDDKGQVFIACPTFYPFRLEKKKIVMCNSYWDGGWMINSGFENVGDIVGWRRQQSEK
jgi:hypothetical protein